MNRTKIYMKNGSKIGGIEMRSDVHLIYAGCPCCGADLETRENLTDDHGWTWVSWWCSSCEKLIDEPHFAVFPALEQIKKRIEKEA